MCDWVNIFAFCTGLFYVFLGGKDCACLQAGATSEQRCSNVVGVPSSTGLRIVSEHPPLEMEFVSTQNSEAATLDIIQKLSRLQSYNREFLDSGLKIQIAQHFKIIRDKIEPLIDKMKKIKNGTLLFDLLILQAKMDYEIKNISAMSTLKVVKILDDIDDDLDKIERTPFSQRFKSAG